MLRNPVAIIAASLQVGKVVAMPQPPRERTPRARANQRTRQRRRTPKSRATLTRESVLDTTIALLDNQGEDKLTVRGLAAELGSGAASIYWYAENKEQLLNIATGEIISRAVAEHRTRIEGSSESAVELASGKKIPPFQPHKATSKTTAEALNEARDLVLCLFKQMELHPWLPMRLMRSDPDMDGSLEFWELLGRPLQRTSLTVEQQFTATMTLMNYAGGTGAEMAFRAQMLDSGEVQELQAMGEQVERWKALSQENFPFVRSIVDTFLHHEDSAQFIGGLDLLLRGLEFEASAE